jgi:fatty aldehyde-generating acyl-ACP reductase
MPQYDFAFIVHPRSVSDMKKNFPLLRVFPDLLVEMLSPIFPPFIASTIEGVTDKNGKSIAGCIIGCPLTARMMLADKNRSSRKVLGAAKIAERVGAKIIGLGAFTSPVTNGGNDLLGKVKLGITTGNAFTAGLALEDVTAICRQMNKSLSDIEIAIVGATGSIGSGIAKALLKRGANKLLLIGKSPENIKELEKKIGSGPGLRYSISIADCISADLVVMATASAGAVLAAENIKQGAAIYDLTQPKNVSREILNGREDIELFEGGEVLTPAIKPNFDLGLPDGRSFACFSETVLLAMDQDYNDSLGKVSVEKIEKMLDLAQKYGFKSALKI